MNKYAKIALGILLTAVVALLFYKNIYLPKSTYETYTPKQGTTSVEVFGIGELSAEKIYPVGTPTGGKVLSLYTDQGKWIKKGDLIAKIDPVDLETRLLSAKASLQRAKLDRQSAKKEYRIAKDQAALSLSSYDKDLQVYKAKGISTFAYEKSKTEMMTSQSQEEIAKTKIASLGIRLQEIEEEIRGLQIRLAQMTIYAPVDGFVIEKNVEQDQSLPPSATLVRIVDPKTLWIQAWVDERISGKVAVGQQASITLRSREGKPLKGIVRRIAAMSDPVTEEREVDVGFVKIPKPFYINEQAEVSIAIETFGGLYKIPLTLLTQYKNETGIWIVQSEKAHFQKLDIIARDSEYAGVREGVDRQTNIIVPDSKKKPLFEGSTVSL